MQFIRNKYQYPWIYFQDQLVVKDKFSRYRTVVCYVWVSLSGTFVMFWHSSVIVLLQYQLKRSSLTEDDAFAFLKGNIQGKCITYIGFYEALQQVGTFQLGQ